MAAWVTCSSFAAAVKLPQRAAASNARSPLKKTGRRAKPPHSKDFLASALDQIVGDARLSVPLLLLIQIGRPKVSKTLDLANLIRIPVSVGALWVLATSVASA